MEKNLTVIERNIPSIVNLFREQYPDALYHYTTADGLLGIARSTELHLTDIRFLNDKNEFYHAFEVALDFLQHYKFDDEIENKFSYFICNMITEFIFEFRNKAYYAPFVISFSIDNDNLSLWRGYCPGGGYSLGMDSIKLAQIANENGLFLRPCIYSKENKFQIIKHVFDYIVNEFKQKYLVSDLNRLYSLSVDTITSGFEKFTEFLIELSPIFKHDSFKDEHEWRLFSDVNTLLTRNNIKFRSKNNVITPYVGLDIKEIGTKKLSFCSITCAPQLGDYPLNNSIERFLDTQDIKCGKIIRSLSPFRT